MKLNELLQTGDVIHSKFHPAHYVVSDNFVRNRVTEDKDSLDSFGYKVIPSWVDSIVRGAEDITEQLRTTLAQPELKFGQVWRNKEDENDRLVVVEVTDVGVVTRHEGESIDWEYSLDHLPKYYTLEDKS